MARKKTKIVCTMGPATESDEVLRELILAGMNVLTSRTVAMSITAL